MDSLFPKKAISLKKVDEKYSRRCHTTL